MKRVLCAFIIAGAGLFLSSFMQFVSDITVATKQAHTEQLPLPPWPVENVNLELPDLVANRLPEPPTDHINLLAGYERELQCLAQAVYFEARSEPLDGQLAVAQVVLHRVETPAYPNSICGVVFQNERWRHRCQFSFACDGRSDRPRNPQAWAVAVAVSQIALNDEWDDLTDQATHYHADYVQPGWRLAFTNTAQHGRHIFYRDDTAWRSHMGD